MRTASLVTSFALVAMTAGSARAGAALDDDSHKAGVAGQPAALTAEEPVVADTTPVEYGVGLRLRSVYIPKPILGLFLERAAGGSQNIGIGADITRRRGNTELQLGFEYEKITVGEGVWINKGDSVPSNEADYVLSPEHSGHSLGWFTIEFTFINNAPINKWLAFRYGGGAGIGILAGELDHYNIQCAPGSSNSSPEPGCVPPRFGGQGQYTDPQPGQAIQVAYNLPPVFPVVNAIIGLQFKPLEKWTINLEGGIRTLPFLGVESSYFF